MRISLLCAVRLIILFSFLVFIQACKSDYDAPCRDVYYASENLTSLEQGWWPYTLADTIYFIKDNGDTATFMMDTAQEASTMVPYTNNPECLPDQKVYQRLFNTFTDQVSMTTFYTDIRKYEQVINVAINTKSFTFSFAALSSSDSVTFPMLEYFGTPFNMVYVAVVGSDSLYYSTSKGLIRYKGNGLQFVFLK